MTKHLLAGFAACLAAAGTANAFTPRVSDGVGVTEFEEWTFVTPEFWVKADDQGRSQFTLGSGVIAVADPDEWDDLGGPGGAGPKAPRPGNPDQTFDIGFNSQLMSPAVTVPTSGPVAIQFDYSWRPEDSQQAYVRAVYGDGSDAVLLDLNTGNTADTDMPDTNPDINATFQTVLAGLPSDSLALAFEMVDAGNDWWFAIDNIRVFNPLPGGEVYLEENFDGLLPELTGVLDDPEGAPLRNVGEPDERPGRLSDGTLGWTQEPPAGWEINTDDFVSTGPLGGPLQVTGVFGVTRVPEPTTVVLGAIAMGLFAARRR
ncbi:hypothetical protein [Botrimarina sp.]|uniref:hypothetical protein n=1 Tax=Botrimarina sp. TaxID=2795802 RepID=UPI0032EF41BA